jgi:signal transduction histidine kinase
MPEERDSQIEVAALVRQVRHDANNPLTAALGHVQLVLESPGLPEDEMRASLRVVEAELIRLVEILRRLRDVKLPLQGSTRPPGA